MSATTLHTPPQDRTMSRSLVGVLALLTAVAPLAIDMYLPAFPQMAGDLLTTPTGIQMTMTTFLVGLALGQLFVGPLSDGIGRRTPLLIGSGICLVACIACALAPSVEALAAARFIQGLSGAAGVVLARAIIADSSRGPTAAKLLGVLMIISVIAPVMAPLAGGATIAALGWRGVFWVQGALVAVMFVASLIFAKESLTTAHRTAGGISATLHNAGEVLRNRYYVGYLLTFCFSFAALFAYISGSPFVFQNIMGFSPTAFSLLFALNALAITLTSALAAGLAGKVPYRRMIIIGLLIAAMAATGLLVSALTGLPTLATIVLFCVLQASMGLIFGNATALALKQAGNQAGTGSAFLGFLQFLLAATVSPLVGLQGESSAVPMGVLIFGFAALAALSFGVLTRGQRAETAPDTV